MRKLPVDRETAFAVVLAIAVATLFTLVLWPLIRRLLNAVANLYFERSAVRKAAQLRDPRLPQVRVRQTDLVARMTAKDRALYRQAEEFLAQQRILEAAHILEAIKFQRRAIDVLEKAGFIDEACQVLLRMNVPQRAGVLFERNGMLEKAAQCYLQAHQFEAAGNTFLKLAAQDSAHVLRAAEAFERAGKTSSAMQVFASVLSTERVLALAYSNKQHSQLAAYMADAVTAREALAAMTPEHIKRFVAELEPSPRHMRLLAQWSLLPQAAAYQKQILERAAHSSESSAHFWATLPVVERGELSARLPSLGLAPEAFAQHNLCVGHLSQEAQRRRA